MYCYIFLLAECLPYVWQNLKLELCSGEKDRVLLTRMRPGSSTNHVNNPPSFVFQQIYIIFQTLLWVLMVCRDQDRQVVAFGLICLLNIFHLPRLSYSQWWENLFSSPASLIFVLFVICEVVITENVIALFTQWKNDCITYVTVTNGQGTLALLSWKGKNKKEQLNDLSELLDKRVWVFVLFSETKLQVCYVSISSKGFLKVTTNICMGGILFDFYHCTVMNFFVQTNIQQCQTCKKKKTPSVFLCSSRDKQYKLEP